MSNRKISYYIILGLIIILSIIITVMCINVIYTNQKNISDTKNLIGKIQNQENEIEINQQELESLNTKFNNYEAKEEKYKEIKKIEEDNDEIMEKISSQEDSNKEISNKIKKLEEENKKKKENQQTALSACKISFDGIGSCEIKQDILMLTPYDTSIIFQAKLNTSSWQELVSSTKSAALNMVKYNIDGIVIANPANPDNVILSVSSLGFVLYDLGKES